MKTLIFKGLLGLLLSLLPVGAWAQLHDMVTYPKISKDLAALTIRLTRLSAGEILATEAQIFETDNIKEWALYSDSLQQGLRTLAGYQAEQDSTSQANGSSGTQQPDSLSWDSWEGGGYGYGDGTTTHRSSKKVKTRLEWYWLGRGLLREILDLVHLYMEFVDRLEEKEYAFGALQNETVAVFYDEGRNALQVFQNTYELIKERDEADMGMSAQQCYDLGKLLTKETNRINRRLKWQMLRVERFDKSKVPNQVLNEIGKRLTDGQVNPGTKSDFDPAKLNQQW